MTGAPNFLNKNIGWFALAGSGIAIFLTFPRAVENFEPLETTRMQKEFEVLTDKESGNIYGWIAGKDGEQRFVKMDENSENKVRKEREKAKEEEEKKEALARGEEPEIIFVQVPSNNKKDIRSQEIFEKNTTYKDYKVNAKVKYRLREKSMLYRLAISLTPYRDSETNTSCVEEYQSKKMEGLLKGKDNQVRFRFVDADDFWLKDSIIPLNESRANNYQTTVIDSYHKDDCGNLSKLVFHGRMSEIRMPDYRWVEDGKLLFGGVTIVEPPKEVSSE